VLNSTMAPSGLLARGKEDDVGPSAAAHHIGVSQATSWGIYGRLLGALATWVVPPLTFDNNVDVATATTRRSSHLY
jgi:hypothetical protein